MSNHSSEQDWSGLIGFGVIALSVWLIVVFLFPDGWRIKYSLKYFVSYDNVYVDDQPSLCDWWHAPLGDKACHYEKNILIVRWNKSKDGGSIVSYDDGETWHPSTPDYGIKIPSSHVFVSWEKKQDP